MDAKICKRRAPGDYIAIIRRRSVLEELCYERISRCGWRQLRNQRWFPGIETVNECLRNVDRTRACGSLRNDFSCSSYLNGGRNTVLRTLSVRAGNGRVFELIDNFPMATLGKGFSSL
jgi:hypothetical protein